MIESDVIGGRELARTLGNLPVQLEKKIMRSALRAGAAVFLKEVRPRIPVEHGDLARSARVTTRYSKGQVTASVKVGNAVAWYAHFIEFGTRPHVIKAKPGHLMRFNGAVAREVHHPGIRPRPFMRPAADAAFPQAVAAVTAKIRERLRKEGFTAPEPADSE